MKREEVKGPCYKRTRRNHLLGASACLIGLLLFLGLILFDSKFLEPFRLEQSRNENPLLSSTSHTKTKTRSPLQRANHGGSSADRITFQLHPALPGEGPLRNASMGMSYRCPAEDETKRTKTLPPVLQGQGILNFATVVTSDLNTLFIGDSVAQQFSEAMDESRGMFHSWNRFNVSTDDPNRIRRKRLMREWRGGYRETLSVSSLLRGGGLSAYWRITDLWDTANRNKPMPPAEGGGWNKRQKKKLLRALPPEANGTFDAVILNYNSWISPTNVTNERYEESINLASSKMGAKVIILVTYPFSRLVKSKEEWEAIHHNNQMLRSVARNHRLTWNITNPYVLVLEFANFTNQLLWSNARNLGINLSDPRQVSREKDWALKDNVTSLLPMLNPWLHTASICAKYPNSSPQPPCLLNYISCDDMHWCTETIGGRLSAGLSCLLGCAFNDCQPGDNNEGTGEESISHITLCEKKCNDRFMSLTPIDPQWMNANSTLRSCEA